MNFDRYAVTIEKEPAGERLDTVLSLLLEDFSRSNIQRLIEGGCVAVNGEICLVKKKKVCEGDLITLDVPKPKNIEARPENIPIDIIFEDSDLLVVNKGKDMVVHPAAGNETGTLVNAILHHCGDLSSINGMIRPGIVHRIDKDTTGLLVVAKNDSAHKVLAEQLAAHSMRRTYRAMVYNNFTEETGIIDLPLGRDPKNRLKRAVTDLNSKNAVTHYKVLERFGAFTYLELQLETGRTHQIRVHLSYKNHPIVGDPLYGPKNPVFGLKSQLLHARTLGFIHPKSAEYMEFECPLPEEFQRVLDLLQSRKK